MTAFHRAAAGGVVFPLVLLVLSVTAATTAFMLFVLAVMRVAAAGMMLALLALMFLMLFFAFVLGLAAAFQRDATGRAMTAARVIRPVHRLFAFGVTAVLQRDAASSPLLLAAATRETVLFLVGLFDLGRADSVVFLDLGAGLAASGVAATADVTALSGRHIPGRIFHVPHFHRTVPFPG